MHIPLCKVHITLPAWTDSRRDRGSYRWISCRRQNISSWTALPVQLSGHGINTQPALPLPNPDVTHHSNQSQKS